jgi:hypothetical protein
MLIPEITPNTPVKKTWAEPKVLIISKNNVLASKAYPNVHEGTGKYTADTSYASFVNQAGTSRIMLTKHGNVLGHKSSAVS